MNDEHAESIVEKIKGVFKNAVGLPPGDKTPHGEGAPATDPETPRGTLTADDAEGLPPRGGTGVAVE
jgi:hypothetical protein